VYSVDGAGGNDTLIGGPDDDAFVFVAGSGNYGNDSVDGGGGFDSLSFGAGRSAIVADMRAGTLSGGGVSGSGSVTYTRIEQISGTAFDDHITANDGSEEFFGASVAGGAGNDTLIGGAAGDSLTGDGVGVGNDQIRAGGGDDIMSLNYRISDGSYGNDFVDGGAGSDLLVLTMGFSDIVVDLDAGTFTGGAVDGSGSATLVSIERIQIEGGDDLVLGNASANELATGGGNDTLNGGAGNDTLVGGGGRDIYVFSVTPGTSNADVIADYEPGNDEIHLDSSVHANIGPEGRLAANDPRFAANSTGTAQDTSDRIIHNTLTNEVFYDADGSGAGAAQLLATVSTPSLAATDFVVAGGSQPGQVINGTAGNDTLSGTSGNDTINGLGGNDLLLAGSTGGADVFDGGMARTRSSSRSGRRARWSSTSAPVASAAGVRGRSASRTSSA
jgi:Ca2+-binding RTX toxin-like protein